MEPSYNKALKGYKWRSRVRYSYKRTLTRINFLGKNSSNGDDLSTSVCKSTCYNLQEYIPDSLKPQIERLHISWETNDGEFTTADLFYLTKLVPLLISIKVGDIVLIKQTSEDGKQTSRCIWNGVSFQNMSLKIPSNFRIITDFADCSCWKHIVGDQVYLNLPVAIAQCVWETRRSITIADIPENMEASYYYLLMQHSVFYLIQVPANQRVYTIFVCFKFPTCIFNTLPSGYYRAINSLYLLWTEVDFINDMLV